MCRRKACLFTRNRCAHGAGGVGLFFIFLWFGCIKMKSAEALHRDLSVLPRKINPPLPLLGPVRALFGSGRPPYLLVPTLFWSAKGHDPPHPQALCQGFNNRSCVPAVHHQASEEPSPSGTVHAKEYLRHWPQQNSPVDGKPLIGLSRKLMGMGCNWVIVSAVCWLA